MSAFTGAGGLDLGLHHAGFKCVGCIESDPIARRTIEANGLWPLLTPGDICKLVNEITPSKLGLVRGELGVLAGAPPCQPFSKAAQWAKSGRSGLHDERANCISAFFEIAANFLPTVIVLENVPGFVRGSTSALPRINEIVERINLVHGTSYRLQWAVLDAADFGVPQRRQRAIIVAFRDGGDFRFPSPTHRDTPVRAYDAIGELRIEPLPTPKGKWAKLLGTIPEGANYLYHTPQGSGRPLFGSRTKYWSFLLKLAKDRPSWTLPAQPGPATGPFHWNGRPLAVQELLRLQSFPIRWKIAGARGEQVRQIGNATPPLLAEVLGRQIATQLFGSTFATQPRLHIRRKRSIPGPNRVKPVPREFQVLEGAHCPHAGIGKGPRPTGAS